MRRVFFIVGPSATGKSELGADVAHELNAEIISADAFQIYRGLDLLTAKPDASTLAKAQHHLIGTTPLSEEMNAEKYRCAATRAVDEINSRGKLAIIVGGSGLYIKALTHGLAPLPKSDPKLREKLNAMSLNALRSQLLKRDPEAAKTIDLNNRRRVVRALEICLLTGKPASLQRRQWSYQAENATSGDLQSAAGATWRSPLLEGTQTGLSASPAAGVFVVRDREELYERINQRVEAMFERGVIEEVRAAGATSATASQMIGLREIRELLEGKMSPDPAKPGSSFKVKEESGHEVQTEGAGRSSRFGEPAALWAQSGSLLQCIAQIQQATRRYAKRQLTWFRHQSNFESLNLSLFTHNEAVKWISQRARRCFAQRDD